MLKNKNVTRFSSLFELGMLRLCLAEALNEKNLMFLFKNYVNVFKKIYILALKIFRPRSRK